MLRVVKKMLMRVQVRYDDTKSLNRKANVMCVFGHNVAPQRDCGHSIKDLYLTLQKIWEYDLLVLSKISKNTNNITEN